MADLTAMQIMVKVLGDDSQLNATLDRAQSKASGFGKALKTAMGIGAAAIAATATATAAFTKTMISSSAEVAAYGDNIDKMSQKMGMSAEAYQEWDAVMQHSGTSMETMKASMKTLANAVESGNEAFQRIGLTQEEIANMSQEDLFAATIAGLQNVEDTTERTYLAGQLLGRGATELGALLNTSAEDTQAMRDRVHELGGVMSDEAVKAAAQFQDNLQDMRTAFDGVKRGIVSNMLPSMNRLMAGFTSLIIGEEGAEEAIREGFEGMAENVAEGATRFAEIAETVLPAFVDAISENLPVLMEAGFQIITALGSAIIENLPTLIDGALNIVITLSKGIVQHLPEIAVGAAALIYEIIGILGSHLNDLLTAGAELVKNIASGIAQGAPEAFNAVMLMLMDILASIGQVAADFITWGGQLISNLASGIWSKVEEAKTKAKDVFEAIKKAFTDKISDFIEIGSNIVKGIAEGIKRGATTVINAAKQVAQDAFNAAKNFLGIESPSKLFRKEVGENIAEGMALGITDGAASIVKAMNDLGSVAVGTVNSTSGEGESSYSGAVSQTVNIYAPTELNPSEVARQTRKANQELILALRGV